MSFMAYGLALNSDVQKKLQNEIDETLTNCQGKLTYEALHKMKYMDMVVSETLKKWPSGFYLDRVCVQSYTIDPINLDEKPLTLEKGDMVLIPVVGIHHDPKYYTNPNKFDPERFSDENKHTIQAFSYMLLVPVREIVLLLPEARKDNDIQELEDTVDTGFATVKEHNIHYGDKKRRLHLTDEYFGVHLFTKPALCNRELDLVKKITVKDFDQFIDRNKLIPDDVEPLMDKNLFNLRGQRWRDMRATLCPSFTSSKMKMIFRLLSEYANELARYLEKQNESALQVEVKDIFTRFVNDAIASIAFGLENNPLDNKSNEFYTIGKRITSIRGLQFFLFSLYQMISTIAKLNSLKKNRKQKESKTPDTISLDRVGVPNYAKLQRWLLRKGGKELLQLAWNEMVKYKSLCKYFTKRFDRLNSCVRHLLKVSNFSDIIFTHPVLDLRGGDDNEGLSHK
ncbi:hypothetical protein FQA39_LY15517 [Lamprigera yunnana]|nr:hypothetical protein FQA39_LY15517 [Lamprigera yunnana]